MCLGVSKLDKSSNVRATTSSLVEYRSMKHSLLQQDFISPVLFKNLQWGKCSLIVRKSLIDHFSARPLKIQIIVQQPNHFLSPRGASFIPAKQPHVIFKYGEIFKLFNVVHIAFWEEKSWCVFPRVFLDFYPHCILKFLAINLFNGEIYHLEDRTSRNDSWFSNYWVVKLFSILSYQITLNRLNFCGTSWGSERLIGFLRQIGRNLDFSYPNMPFSD